MEGDGRFKVPSTVTGELDSVPAAHVDTHGEAKSPMLPTVYLSEPSDPTLSSSGFLEPSMGPADGRADEGVINVMPPTPFLIRFVLNNLFFAIFSISLTLFNFFFVVAWFTVLREIRLMEDQVLSDVSGVSLYTYQ